MPLPAGDFWIKIQKEIQGKSEREQLRILQGYLDSWHDAWKGPYWDLKERLRKLVAKLENTESIRSRGQQDPFHVKRTGDAQVGFVGLPNSGKSALVYALTGASTVIADYPFATQHPTPGMLPCEGGSVQLVDTPPMVDGLSDGEGAGRPLLHLISTMDALVLVVDLSKEPTTQIQKILTELANAHIKPMPHPRQTVLRIKGKGGIKFRGPGIPKADRSAACRLLTEANIPHAEVVICTRFAEDELLAQLEDRKRIPALILANKNDVPGAAARLNTVRDAYPEYHVIDTNFLDETHFDLLGNRLLDLVGLVRVFLLEKPTEDAERAPHLVPCSSTIRDVADRVDASRAESLSGARLWGPSAALQGQVVSVQHLVQDGDQIHLQM